MKEMDRIALFDVDGTLTPPRRDLDPDMARALSELKVPFAVAAGSNRALIEHQFLEPLWASGFRGDFDAFLSNGGLHARCHFSRAYEIEVIDEFDFAAHLGKEGFLRLVAALDNVLTLDGLKLPPHQKIVGKQIIDRGCMMNFAPAGREQARVSEEGRAARATFVEFDRAAGYRVRVREHLERELRELMDEKGLQILIGGETSFDLVIKGRDKTNALRVLLEQGARSVVFFGDALFDGGNDSPVMDFVENYAGAGPCPVEAVPVAGWRNTIEILQARGWLREQFTENEQ